MGPGSAAHRRRDAALRPGHGRAIADQSPSRHTFAFSRRVRPELCGVALPSSQQGHREGRAPAGTRVRALEKMHTGWTTGSADRSAFPARWFTAYFALSPGSDALLPPSPCGWLMRAPGRATHITARLDAQTPGVRTTRLDVQCYFRPAENTANLENDGVFCFSPDKQKYAQIRQAPLGPSVMAD